MTSAKMREIIREDANELNAKYRITRDGEVHYYGSKDDVGKATGWYLVSNNPEAFALQILRERHHAQMRKQGML